jgi:hypothetical protein
MQIRTFICVMIFIIFGWRLIEHFKSTDAPYSVVLKQLQATWSAQEALADIKTGNTRANSVPHDLPKVKHQAKKLEFKLYSDLAQILWRDFTTGYLEPTIHTVNLDTAYPPLVMHMKRAMIEGRQQSCNAFYQDGSRCDSYECMLDACFPWPVRATAIVPRLPIHDAAEIEVRCSPQLPFNSSMVGETVYSCDYYQNWLEVVNYTVTELIEERRKMQPIILDEN